MMKDKLTCFKCGEKLSITEWDNWFGHLEHDGIRVLLCNYCKNGWINFWTVLHRNGLTLKSHKLTWKQAFDLWSEGGAKVKVVLT